MKQLTLSTVCVIATLAAVPSLAAAQGQPGGRAPSGDMECSHTPPAKARAATQGQEQGKKMDCIVVMGYPSQDGRAELRRTLEKEAKENLSKVIRSDLKKLTTRKPTS